MISGKFKQMSNSQLRSKIKELEAKGNKIEAGRYKKELAKRGITESDEIESESEIEE